MYTIKFRRFDESYPIVDRDKDVVERFVETTQLKTGTEIWHRPFNFNSEKEWTDWFKRFIEGSGDSLVVPGNYPDSKFNNWRTLEKQGELSEDAIPPSVYIEYMTYYDEEGEFKKCIILDTECFIMNAQGQTVDSFAA